MATKKCDKDKSYHEGANDERTVVLAKIRRMRRHDDWAVYGLATLEEWLLNRVKRNKLKAGGL